LTGRGPSEGGIGLKKLPRELGKSLASLSRARDLHGRATEKSRAVPGGRRNLDARNQAFNLKTAAGRHVEDRVATLGREVMKRGDLSGTDPLPVISAWHRLGDARAKLAEHQNVERGVVKNFREAKAAGNRVLVRAYKVQLKQIRDTRRNPAAKERKAAIALGRAFLEAYVDGPQ
jgi:hypothetical protein